MSKDHRRQTKNISLISQVIELTAIDVEEEFERLRSFLANFSLLQHLLSTKNDNKTFLKEKKYDDKEALACVKQFEASVSQANKEQDHVIRSMTAAMNESFNKCTCTRNVCH